MNVVIFGASGYGGAELIRSILLHPYFELVGVSANSNVGASIGGTYSHLSFSKVSDLIFITNEELIELKNCIPRQEPFEVAISLMSCPTFLRRERKLYRWSTYNRRSLSG